MSEIDVGEDASAIKSADDTNLVFHLRDLSSSMYEAWLKEFDGIDGVEVSKGDIFDGTSADAIVSPANSFGFMDGGIDGVYSRRFGWELSERLREALRTAHDGELPVGQAQIIQIKDDPDFSYLISAPTMRVPGNVSDTANAYLAFRATIRIVQKHNATVDWLNNNGADNQGHTRIKTVLCPGLGTAIGMMPVDRCAIQMRQAYECSFLKNPPAVSSLAMAASIDHQMRGIT